MKKYILIILSIFVILTLASAVSGADLENTTIPGLNITTDLDTAFSLSQNENRTLAIIFDQDSCVYCDIFKEDVLTNPDIQNELNERFIVLFVDINENPDIADKYDVYGTPSVRFLDSNGTYVLRINGFCQSDEFLQILKEI